ncbi:hypothetical protein P3X46_007742 [Hevea brasiliensis]|uniref:DUF4378 domain-containing protein n=1 Tax=Hevea brasiliensis TaxID=3981 RepID=A0ABQ9MVG3_HEVBR|nr:uncharacterized protein LOC110636168 [Hevea brasiliensis]XP_021641425.2 uncharacterized protein LOC110636168 [Hevea brasiliensis]KAJ9183948.1 hypothetical protein P3X46_007742 [Hevea brasiliensis]
MYRTFVTCDDPKGVVECGSIRKSKSASKRMEDQFYSRRTQKNSKSNTSLAYKEKKEEMVTREIIEDHSPSSFQLLEVSRGAQKLNQLIDSLSKGLSYDGQPKDIAKELLKGALDLQESLTMLGKLQEASQYMDQSKKKQEKPERRKFVEVGNERTNSHLPGDQNHQLGFQKPRLSADGSSKDCIEELRNAIRDGFARQNLFNTSTRERTYFDRRKMDSISHIPSTSSSQLSAEQSNSIHSSDSCVSQTALQKKGKGPNLIATLMGLEDVPSKKLMQPPERQLDMKMNLNQRRPVFDIEMPKLRKPQPTMHKVDSERRMLKELLETVQFQGLLKSSSAKELNSQSHHSNDIHSKQRLINDIPPIVLIKPLRVPCLESEEPHAPVVWGEGALNTKMMLRKMKIEEAFASRSVDNKEGSLNANKMHCRTEADDNPTKRVIQKGTKDHMEVVREEHEVRAIEQKQWAVNAKKGHRKLEAGKAPVKRFSYEDRGKDHNRVVPAVEEKEVNKNLKDPSIVKDSNPATDQRQKKESTDKKVDQIQKVVASSRKPVEREIVKTKIVSRSQDQPKITSTKLRKSENGSETTNHHISQQHTTTRKTISKLTTQTTIDNSKDPKQKEKQASKHRTAKPITENLKCKEHDGRIDLIYNDHSEEEGSSITHADQLSIEEEANDSKLQTEGHCDDNQSSVSSITMLTTEYRKNAKSSEEADDHVTCVRTDDTSFNSAYQLKDWLSSSSSFLNLTDELFNLNTSSAKVLPTAGTCDSEVTDAKLSLDYANEFIERRSLPDSQTRFPLLSYMGDSRIQLSLDKLAEEVCSGVETLRSYQKLACDYLLTDSLYATLEKDMRCKEVVSGIWDLGWRNGFSVEEVEQVLNDLEKMIVCELIEEVFS